MQFSSAEYEGGKMPKITLNELNSLLIDFGQSRELRQGYDFASSRLSILVTAASFDFDGAFLRVWYCSDGQNVALVTYNCEKGQQRLELSDCEGIVQNLKFGPSKRPEG
jgi:hypothetical protein